MEVTYVPRSTAVPPLAAIVLVTPFILTECVCDVADLPATAVCNAAILVAFYLPLLPAYAVVAVSPNDNPEELTRSSSSPLPTSTVPAILSTYICSPTGVALVGIPLSVSGRGRVMSSA